MLLGGIAPGLHWEDVLLLFVLFFHHSSVFTPNF